MYIDQTNIRKNAIEYREFQIRIAEVALTKNTLAVLPTGLGKTIIALLLIAKKLQNQQSKILFLAPTKPLVLQHAAILKEFLTIPKDRIVIFTGEVPPEKRKELWHHSNIVVSTPQVIENDLLTNRISLATVSLLIFDEAHHATGNYAYVFVNDQYKSQHPTPHVFGMTASPGNNAEKILEICKNLSIQNVEIRTKEDPDVKPYVHDISFTWKKISIPDEFSYALQLLRNALSIRLKVLKNMEFIDTDSVSIITKTKLLDAQKKIQQEIQSRINPPKLLFSAAATQSEALKISYAIEILETQGVQSVRQYFQRMLLEASSKSSSKAVKQLIEDPLILETIAYLKSLQIEHPKLDAVEEIIVKQLEIKPNSLIIVFTHFRDTSLVVEKCLRKNQKIKPVRFVGQGGKINDKGLTQKQQAEIIEKFRNGVYNVLIATSVAEEGLDIPSTELVVFYEPIPSEIRNIQRRGRTARKMPGKVVILLATKTTDEAYYWASIRREKQMRSQLTLLRSKLHTSMEQISNMPSISKEKVDHQQTLETYSAHQDGTVLIVDHREYKSTIARLLSQKSLIIKPKQLDVGDYIVSSRIGVERKTVDDFLQSLISGKLFDQLHRLRSAYPRPILILEGEGLFTKRNVNHNAIYGSLIAICVDFGIPILKTQTPEETADLLAVMAKREQQQEQKPVVLRGEKPSMTLSERQRFVIEGLPLISSVMAKRLLQHFGSIPSLVNASQDELQEVFGVGKRIANEIYSVLHEEYTEE